MSHAQAAVIDGLVCFIAVVLFAIGMELERIAIELKRMNDREDKRK